MGKVSAIEIPHTIIKHPIRNFIYNKKTQLKCYKLFERN